ILLNSYTRAESPPSAPEKPDHGDIDILVTSPLHNFTRQDLAHALQGIDHLQIGHISSFAIPLSTTNKSDLFQLDVHTCKPELFEWETILTAYGDLWRILGMSANRLGFTINNTGLHLRVAEIEAVHPKDCLLNLTSDPREIFEFLALDKARFDAGFTTLDDLFAWATSSRFFRRRYFEKEITETKGREAERPMYADFRTRWLPEHPEVGVTQGSSSAYRVVLTDEALMKFQKGEEYEMMAESHRKRVLKDLMWRKIAKALPMEGKELGTAMKALKSLLRWRDGAPELLSDDQTSERLPALEEAVVDAEVLPWVLDHWQEAVEIYEKSVESKQCATNPYL
ncbi:MAG: hypothetical protein Q9170_005995, partial [Blastenia crenularia]